MTTLKGIFPDLKPTRRKNFIHENVKNLHRMKKCFHTNGGVEEIRKSHIHNQKKANSNTHLRNCNHIEDILPKKINTVLHVKQHENMTKGTANNKSDHQQELCKKSNVPALNKTTTCTKKVMRLHNNNLSVKQKKEDHKHLHNSIKRLHGKMLSRPNLSYTSIRDVNKNVKHQTEVKSQGIQTLNTTEIDSLYSEGIIKYPSKKCLNSNESINNDNRDEQIDKLSNDVINLSLKGEGTEFVEKTMQNQNDLKDPKILTSKEETDFIKSNNEHSVTTNNAVTETKNNTNNPNNVKNGKYNNINNNNFPTANYRMGVVPKYIKIRKETQEKIQKAKTEEVDVNCPQGHVPLPDHERKETLCMLRKNYQDYVNELNMLPIKADTLRAQRRKIEIEKQLNKLEEGIKVFSRPKVYVKMNA